jgi:uncharacterized alpha-E superfamily protein
MLSRVADSLFWMSRYMERAENIARIVDVNLQLLLDSQKLDDKTLRSLWLAVVQSLGDEESFFELYKKADSRSVTEYLTFNKDNPDSVMNCVARTRENARMVRDQLSNEMWEEINRMYLYVLSKDAKTAARSDPSAFFREVKLGSYLFQGLTDSTIPQDEGHHFILLGRYLERADKTTRILDTKYFILLPSIGEVGGAMDKIQWVAVLRSCSAHEAYQRIYLSDVEPKKITDLLILDETFPRSIRFSMTQFDNSLRAISGTGDDHFSNTAEKLSGRLLSDLNFSTVDDIFVTGLHEYLDQLQARFNEIGRSLLDTYIFYPIIDSGSSGRHQQQQQQQQ